MQSITDPSHILCFAHQGEARAFLDSGLWQNCSDFGELKVFKSTARNELPDYLCLTGEGLWKSYDVINQLLYQLKAQHQALNFEIINLGIAAGLTKEVQLGEVYFIDLCLRESRSGASFQTYTPAPSKGHNCYPLITVEERLRNKAVTKSIAAFAPLADREGWAIARAAKAHGLPLTMLKVVSDLPYLQSNTEDEKQNCDLIQQKAEEFSLLLWNSYQKLPKTVVKQKFSLVQNSTPTGLYFTHALKKRWEKILQLYGVKNQQECDLFLQKQITHLNELKGLPGKKMAIALIEKLEAELFPERMVMQEQLQRLAFPLQLLQQKGIAQYRWSKEQEGKIELQANLADQQEMQALVMALQSLDWNKIQDFFHGKASQDADHV